MSKRDRSGAGTLIIVQDRILLLQRNDRSSYPSTWAPPGGRIDPGESPFEAALRETKEESNIDLKIFYHTDRFTQPLSDHDEIGTYTTYVYHIPTRYTPDDFDVKIDHESKGWGWFTVDEMRHMNLHPGVYTLLEYIGLEL